MILSRKGESLNIGGKIFTVGSRVKANSISEEYEGLYGEIVEIRTGEDRETENEGIDLDIYVRFEIPEHPQDIEKIEKRFSEYGEPKTIDEIALDLVIMGEDELEPVE